MGTALSYPPRAPTGVRMAALSGGLPWTLSWKGQTFESLHISLPRWGSLGRGRDWGLGVRGFSVSHALSVWGRVC